MKAQVLLLILLMLTNKLVAQDIPQLEPNSVGPRLDFSQEFIDKYNSPKAFEDCEQVYEKMEEEGRTWDQLTEEELEVLEYCDEVKEDVWDIIGGGCSWYCGGGPKLVTASSHLSSQGSNNYEPQNAHDLSYESAWVEGVEGQGIGEFLEYKFDAASPRITEIIVVNGYVKSKSAWLSNSRVKKLRVYFNNEPIADLNLKDVRASQHFKFEPIGYGNRANSNSQLKPWHLKFEILAVYKGTKYSDTVISEIYFDGIDVH